MRSSLADGRVASKEFEPWRPGNRCPRRSRRIRDFACLPSSGRRAHCPSSAGGRAPSGGPRRRAVRRLCPSSTNEITAVVHIRRSELARLLEPACFEWLLGIEDTFITAPHAKTGRTLDEYELTGHYERWREDIELFAQAKVRAVRYGIPWHRINPAPGRWDFEWTDAAIERLLELGIAPIIDLVHYGVPPWIEGAWLAADFPQHMAEYATRVAQR